LQFLLAPIPDSEFLCPSSGGAACAFLASGGILSKDSAGVQRTITVSVVSHGQGRLVKLLLDDLDAYSAGLIDVILTVNIEEELLFDVKDYRFPVRIIRNTSPQGFGENHNAAFRQAHSRYFCVLNPDIRLNSEPFSALLFSLESDDIGIVAPLVCSTEGTIEDSARRIPTPLRIVAKLLMRNPKPDYVVGPDPVYPDWIAGMFMLFPSHVYECMGGFNERYFLYYEDVDLCSRLSLAGYRIMLNPEVSVVHDARRESHRNFRYLRWHLCSIIRFFLSVVFFRVMFRNVRRKVFHRLIKSRG